MEGIKNTVYIEIQILNLLNYTYKMSEFNFIVHFSFKD